MKHAIAYTSLFWMIAFLIGHEVYDDLKHHAENVALEAYTMAIGEAGKEAKQEIAQNDRSRADIFSVLDKKHR